MTFQNFLSKCGHKNELFVTTGLKSLYVSHIEGIVHEFTRGPISFSTQNSENNFDFASAPDSPLDGIQGPRVLWGKELSNGCVLLCTDVDRYP